MYLSKSKKYIIPYTSAVYDPYKSNTKGTTVLVDNPKDTTALILVGSDKRYTAIKIAVTNTKTNHVEDTYLDLSGTLVERKLGPTAIVLNGLQQLTKYSLAIELVGTPNYKTTAVITTVEDQSIKPVVQDMNVIVISHSLFKLDYELTNTTHKLVATRLVVKRTSEILIDITTDNRYGYDNVPISVPYPKTKYDGRIYFYYDSGYEFYKDFELTTKKIPTTIKCSEVVFKYTDTDSNIVLKYVPDQSSEIIRIDKTSVVVTGGTLVDSDSSTITISKDESLSATVSFKYSDKDNEINEHESEFSIVSNIVSNYEILDVKSNKLGIRNITTSTGLSTDSKLQYFSIESDGTKVARSNKVSITSGVMSIQFINDYQLGIDSAYIAILKINITGSASVDLSKIIKFTTNDTVNNYRVSGSYLSTNTINFRYDREVLAYPINVWKSVEVLNYSPSDNKAYLRMFIDLSTDMNTSKLYLAGNDAIKSAIKFSIGSISNIEVNDLVLHPSSMLEARTDLITINSSDISSDGYVNTAVDVDYDYQHYHNMSTVKVDYHDIDIVLDISALSKVLPNGTLKSSNSVMLITEKKSVEIPVAKIKLVSMSERS